ncbi:2-hydroxychromene-2-carboxylate isomerase [Azohydromonas caseinilytica]|uniref:2-hydroxychromene-2-carboxylate isomerase n=1 Tax=Azohydromonas caseinilytica TaxID=2728836 RepID=A0A848FG06_9BURK|nr:2-hydroxychromene-2-carboxylate isomerase [Azohydromonas caseinilytica]NML17249.1 2-hydroxychromene-2-carboxylate isomerase [Azohydromonas caseinilytica]
MRSIADAPVGIELWFDFASPYAYLSVMRIEEAAARRGLAVAWKPFLLGPIFSAQGWESSPFVLQKQKGAYVWKDLARQCRKHGLPWRQPSAFPRGSVLPARVALWGGGAPWVAEFCRQAMRLNFAEDRDIDTVEAVGGVLAALGLDADAAIAQACAEAHKPLLRRQTEAARAQGIFGAPTFMVRSKMFWGNDRLEDALDFAAGLAAPGPARA